MHLASRQVQSADCACANGGLRRGLSGAVSAGSGAASSSLFISF